MAKRKISGAPFVYGKERMETYAKEHGFNVVDDSYQVVKKHHKKTSMKLDPNGQIRKNSHADEMCEILKVTTYRRDGDLIEGFLVGYPEKGIRFDANEKY